MFSTVLCDAYGPKQVGMVAQALTDLCSPYDNYGWSSTGVYVFWDLVERSPLYIGYSGNLARRFAEHNGLIPCEPKSCQSGKISEYFETAEPALIGISILVQEPFINVLKNCAVQRIADPSSPYEIDAEDVLATESRLIETWERAHGQRPPWNGAPGRIAGRNQAVPDDYHVLEIMSLRRPSFLVSRSMLREVSNEPDLYGKEILLHAERNRLINLQLDERDYALEPDLLEYARGRQPFFD
jgi:hypothetical protein